MVNTQKINPIRSNFLNLKTYFGDEYEVYRNAIIYNDLVFKLPEIQYNSTEINYNTQPKYIFELGLGNVCNLACKYCFVNHSKPHKFIASEHIKIIERLVNHFGKERIYTFFINSDGEILNNFNETVKIINYCKENNYKVILRTNATETNIFNDDKKLKKLLINDFSISYDGRHTTERVFKNGKSTGEIVRNNIKLLISKGKNVQVNIVVTPFTEDIYETVCDLRNLGVQKIMITQQKDKEYSKEELLKVLANFKNFFVKSFFDNIDTKDSIFNFLSYCDFEVPTCNGDLSNFFKVDRFGYMSRCSYIHNKIKIEDFSVNQIITSRKSKCFEKCLFNGICSGTFCAGLDYSIGCELRKMYFEFLFNIIIYYLKNYDIDLTEKIFDFQIKNKI